jgi:hypothetical protein
MQIITSQNNIFVGFSDGSTFTIKFESGRENVEAVKGEEST